MRRTRTISSTFVTDALGGSSARSRLVRSALLCGAVFSCVGLVGCEKSAPAADGDEAAPKAEKNFFPTTEKVDYSQVKVDKPVEAIAPPTPVADTWASRTRALVADVHADLMRCRNEFMIPFQFEKMRLRDVTWLSISEMDAVCRDGDSATKKRGPWAILQFLAREQVGKNPALDRFIAYGHDHVEHARMVSLMTKKVGSPKIAAVSDLAKTSRDRVIEAGREVDAAARDIAGWPDDMLSEDSAVLIAQGQNRDQYAHTLVEHYGKLLEDAVPAYDRLAAQSWQAPNMVKKATLRLWADILTRQLQQDRPRLDKVVDMTEADRKKFVAYLDKVQAVVAAWTKSYERYFENKEGDTWSAKDPWRVAVVKSQKDWQKAHAALSK